MKTLKQIKEEAAVNCVGNGAIAGMGIGPQGEPGKNMVLSKAVKRRKIGGVEVYTPDNKEEK